MNDQFQHAQNWIEGVTVTPCDNTWLDKFNPHDGKLLSKIANSGSEDSRLAVDAAVRAYPDWSSRSAVCRGQVLAEFVNILKNNAERIAECVALETGKPPNDALGEVRAAILQGEYWSGEGMRLHGKSLNSANADKYSHTVREPLGVAALVVPANTPIANIAWKVFPALACGNTAVVKASEDAPMTALVFAQMASEAGVPAGVLNVLQGGGVQAGRALVEDSRVSLISFTGSTHVGKQIAETASKRLARVSLELGGKNPFVICDDADIENAVQWAALSAFSNAGQRCAAASRLIVFRKVYDEVKERLILRTGSLRLGVSTDSDLGPVISRKQQTSILEFIDRAKLEGGKILAGGDAPFDDKELGAGYYIMPTLIEGLSPTAEISCREVFGPVAALYPVDDLAEALELANATDYGLTSAIHTKNVDRALWFAHKVKAGVANINCGTYGSEPHMPFGGFGMSGNGTREPGAEALDVYTELKNISFLSRPALV